MGRNTMNTLTRLSLPEGLESIGPEAFPGCGFRLVRVPEHTTETGRDAFPRGAEVTG